jgi:hypothetical protein
MKGLTAKTTFDRLHPLACNYGETSFLYTGNTVGRELYESSAPKFDRPWVGQI